MNARVLSDFTREGACVILLLLTPLLSSPQDMIRFKNGTEYEVMILDRKGDSLVYRLASDPNVSCTVSIDKVDSTWHIFRAPPECSPAVDTHHDISFQTIGKVVKNNPEAYQEYLVAKKYRSASRSLIVPITVIAIYLKYSWISSYFYDNSYVDLIAGVTGAMLTGWCIVLENKSHKHLDKSLRIYHNEPAEPKSRPITLGFGVAPDGVGMILRF